MMKLPKLSADEESKARRLYCDEEYAKSYCQKAIDKYRLSVQLKTKKLASIARKINLSNLSNKQEICQILLEGLSPNYLDEVTVRTFEGLNIGDSFTAAMVSLTAMRRALWRERWRHSPDHVLNTKTVSRLFAERLGIQVPQLYQSEIPSRAIEIRAGCAVKPSFASGSKGVFLIRDSNRILDVRAQEYIKGEAGLRSRIDAYLKSRLVQVDLWQVEELIPAKDGLCPLDVKFLTFYGRVVLVLEVRRYPTLGYNWYNASGEQVITGSDMGLEFKGEGVTAREAEVAAKMSLEIPMPFMRIDFLRSEDGRLVFGEFTPRPGGFQLFDAVTDSLLGREYSAASARLHDDVLSGKSFGVYSHVRAKYMESPFAGAVSALSLSR